MSVAVAAAPAEAATIPEEENASMDVRHVTKIAIAAKSAYSARQRVSITGDGGVRYMRTAGAHL